MDNEYGSLKLVGFDICHIFLNTFTYMGRLIVKLEIHIQRDVPNINF